MHSTPFYKNVTEGILQESLGQLEIVRLWRRPATVTVLQAEFAFFVKSRTPYTLGGCSTRVCAFVARTPPKPVQRGITGNFTGAH